VVRYQDKLRCGLEFVGLSAEQRAAIRDWAEQASAMQPRGEAEAAVSKAPVPEMKKTKGSAGDQPPPPEKPGPVRRKRRRAIWTILTIVTVALLTVLWWRWNQGWEELESGLPNQDEASLTKPQVQVPADVMQKLMIHKVDPEYPAAARQAKLHGVIALDVVVGRDGSVIDVRPLNGPAVLAKSAVDALRWWKFEPYRVNGEPAIVETTVAVEFKP
jgi:TonB family protein